ncbi:sugar phosphate isomerase/epimerase family protein [Thermodesulfobacteriota bacterium]
MLGISTCWWEDASLSGDALIGQVLDMGFEGVELEYRITNPLYHQMKPYLNKKVKVLSIHNFFPRTEELLGRAASGDFFLLSSPDKDERSMAVKYSVRTIEHACDLEAKAVVLHLGRVDMPVSIDTLRNSYKNVIMDQDDGKKFLKNQMDIRESKSLKNLDAALFSLEKLNREAEKKGVFLGVENRHYTHEIPNFDEIGIIMGEFKGGMVRYWHDVGHAAVQENLGLCRQMDLLDAYSKDMIGVHLHDVEGLDDHLAPGMGKIEYEKITPYIKPHLIKILEVHSRVEREALEDGARFMKEKVLK